MKFKQRVITAVVSLIATAGLALVTPQAASAASWMGPESLGGVLTSPPSVSTYQLGSVGDYSLRSRVDAFGLGQNGQLWHKIIDGPWSVDWTLLGAPPVGIYPGSQPAVVSRMQGQIDIFVRGRDNAVWQTWCNPSCTVGWYSLGGIITSDPAVSSWSSTRVDIFARGQNNGLWQKYYNGSGWSNWLSIGYASVPSGQSGALSAYAPAAVSWQSGHIDVFATNTSGTVLHWGCNEPGGGCGVNASPWFSDSLGGVLTAAPAATSSGPGQVGVVGRGLDGNFWLRSFYNGQWGAWVGTPISIGSAPSVANTVTECVCNPPVIYRRFNIYYLGPDRSLQHMWS